ncbi:9238_t:CDS:2 [Diversispora eburnea]|uniref:9238_t:CDS:1 n=1 Tax=Diversispora eburnea TaxID=1213867 RepID=A0A9N9BBF9_9GLOM|nr:9238_t:CDS:2 [Diversispora eburnea]
MSLDLSFFESVDSAMEVETVREYDKTCRNLIAVLNRVHSVHFEEVAQSVIDRIGEVKQHLENLSQIVPYQQYYSDLWTRTVQSSLFIVSFAFYLSTERLITTNEIESLFGDFHISIEECLHGYVTLTSELSRLAINSVTAGDYDRPLRISKFVKELYSGFQLLNLRNDLLRKRFDGIKYNIKKIEEVVYDISLRKLSSSSKSDSVNFTGGDDDL